MANTMVTIKIFQNYYATPLIRLSLRLINNLKVTCNYLSEWNEILYSEQFWRMANTKVTIIFQNYYVKPLIRLLLRVIRSLVSTYQIYMKFRIVTNWRMANTKMTFIFQIYYATPIIRLLIRIISDIAAYYNYLSDFNELLYSSQLKDSEYNVDNYFSKLLCHALN